VKISSMASFHSPRRDQSILSKRRLTLDASCLKQV
jgi:hypothetical protein